jgi:hypothetical protein
MNITEINELLTKVFQQTCYLKDDSKTSYKLFLTASTISEFEEESRASYEKFFSQYDVEIGASKFFYPKEGSNVFVLPLKKLGLTKLVALLNIQLADVASQKIVLQIKDQLLDKSSDCKLYFPSRLDLSEFEDFRIKGQKFLSQYGIESKGSPTILYSEGNKVFVLPVKEVSFNKLVDLWKVKESVGFFFTSTSPRVDEQQFKAVIKRV